ncbi:MAG: TonB-dependent receptor [Chlorobi bacterium]|nr:TonB-dependent receptor [Chlorobiota bacterium]
MAHSKIIKIFFYRIVIKFVLFSLCINIAIIIQAQNNPFKIHGRLIEKNSNNAVMFASVIVYNVKDSTLVSGTISNDKGYFRIKKLPQGKYYLSISSLGYLDKQIVINEYLNNNEIDFGNIFLEIDSKSLDEIIVKDELKLIKLQANKKIVRIDKSIAASGGSAAEALEIVPQISVEGRNIKLKNQSFKVLLNGKPSSITPSQLFDIPASDIIKIEVITNPSVKYNPEGLGGIINVITKKKKKGLNGLVQASGGSDNSYNTAATINFGTKKINLFATANANYYGGYSEGYLDKNINSYIIQHEDVTNRQNFLRYNLKAGFDYDCDSLNLVSIFWSQPNDRGGSKKTTEFKETQNEQTVLNNNDIISNDIYRKNDLTFSYKHLFKRKDTYLTLDAVQSIATEESEYEQITSYIEQKNTGFKHTPSKENKNSDIQLNLNYWLNKKIQFETGLNTIREIETNQNSGAYFDVTNNTWADSISMKNKFVYNENIFGSYGLLTYSYKNIKFNSGIRLEFTYTNTFIDKTNDKNSNNYIDFFPSFGFMYSLNDNLDFSLSYSRRIERPYNFQLCPFVNESDFLSEKMVGNIKLKPAYNDSFELSVSQNWDKISINTDISYVYGSDIISKIYNISQDSISIKTWGNVSENSIYSLYTSINWKAAKWCTMYLSGSYNKTYQLYSYNGIENERDYFDYNIRYTVRLYFKNNWSTYFFTPYYSSINYYTSKVEGGIRIYLGVSKKISDRLTFSLKLNDITNKKYIYYSWSEDFNSKSYMNQNKRSIYFGFIYKFGNRIKNRTRTYLNTRLKMNR